jgi:hypothetical protein
MHRAWHEPQSGQMLVPRSVCNGFGLQDWRGMKKTRSRLGECDGIGRSTATTGL